MTGSASALLAVWQPGFADLVHAANALYLCSYLLRDILWLRVLTVMAGLCMVPFYFACAERPLWAPIGWVALFTVVNLVQIVLLLAERVPRGLADADRELYERVFPDLSVGEFRRILRMATVRDVPAGETVVEQGRPVADMMVLTAGAMDVRRDGRVLATLRPGQFIGEMSFISRQSASADVVATAPSRLLAWSQPGLAGVLDSDAALALKMRGILGRDVVAKLRAPPPAA